MAEATTALDTVYRVLVWVGYAGLAGALAVLLVVWPAGVRQRRLALVALLGSTLLALATAGWLVARLVLVADPGLPRVEGTAAIARLAVLAAVGGFFTDLMDGPVRGRRRSGAAVALLALTATVLAAAAGGRPGQGATQFTGDVVVAIVAVVCGACLAVAAVVVPGDARADVPHLRTRVAATGPPALAAAALAGAVHAIAAERSPWAAAGPPPVVLVVLLVGAAAVCVLGLRRLLRAGPHAAPVPAVATAPAAERLEEPAVRWFAPAEVERRPAIQTYQGPRRTTQVEPAPAPVRARVHEPVERPVRVHEPQPQAAAARVVVLPDTAAARDRAARPERVEPERVEPERVEPEPVDPVGSGPVGSGPVEVDAVEGDAFEVAGAPRPRRPSPAGRNQRVRHVAGLGRLVLPDPAETPQVTRTVRVAGTVEPLVVVLPDTRVPASGR